MFVWNVYIVDVHKDVHMKYVYVCMCVQAKGQFKRRSTANNVEIFIPVPADADTPRFRVSLSPVLSFLLLLLLLSTHPPLPPSLIPQQSTAGYSKYVPEKNALLWTIKTFPVSEAEPR